MSGTGETAPDSLLAVVVYVHVKERQVDNFKRASLDNARQSVQEAGVARFDVIQDAEDETRFALVEVYKTDEAPAAHKATAHYAEWAEKVKDMMEEPRTNTKYRTCFPAGAEGYSVLPALRSGLSEVELGPSAPLSAVHVFVSVKPGDEEAFKEASLANASNSIKERGIARFDLLQEVEDPCKFVLVEVYHEVEAPAAHKDTAHYATWRDTVAEMMAEPRSAVKYTNCFPTSVRGWSGV